MDLKSSYESYGNSLNLTSIGGSFGVVSWGLKHSFRLGRPADLLPIADIGRDFAHHGLFGR